MSADQVEIIEGIRGKIQAVKVRLREEEDRNAELLEKNEELQSLVQQKQSQIKELEERNQKLSLVKSMVAEGDEAREARVQINRIVREIDKCIALLNRS